MQGLPVKDRFLSKKANYAASRSAAYCQRSLSALPLLKTRIAPDFSQV
ncbi:hypothetical protein P10159_0505 [Citrobacter portucalensis]|nr:hypothetical protein P10159_0505 [Citrobacter portucalensis]